MDAAEHMAKESRHDDFPAGLYEFDIQVMQSDFPAIATCALAAFRRTYPESDLMDHHVFKKLQTTQNSRLQKSCKKRFPIDETVDPPISLSPAGSSCTKLAKLKMCNYRL